MRTSHKVVASGTKRTTTFDYLGLTNLVTNESSKKVAGSSTETTSKAYGYDARGVRTTMTQNWAGGSSNDFFYGYDPQGNVSQLLKDGQEGGVRASYGYTPYGGVDDELTEGDDLGDMTGEDRVTPLNYYRYSARRYDVGSGTLDMGARRFDSSTGSFLQQDFLSGALADMGLSTDPLTGNRYSLAGGNPVSFVEIDGHVPADPGPGQCDTYLGLRGHR